MDILSPDSQSAVPDDLSSGLSRRGFLRAGALAGGGIAADFLPYVFDRFRQEDSSSSR